MKNGKNILILVGVAIVAYLLLNYFNKPKEEYSNMGGENGSGSNTQGNTSPFTLPSRPITGVTPMGTPNTPIRSGLDALFNPNSPNYAGYNYVNQYYKGGVDNGGGYNQWVVDNYYQFPLLPPENRQKYLFYKDQYQVIFKGSVHGFPFPTTDWKYEVEPNLEVRITPDGLLYSMHYALHDGLWRPWTRNTDDQKLFNTGQRILLQPREDKKWNYLRNF